MYIVQSRRKGDFLVRGLYLFLLSLPLLAGEPLFREYEGRDSTLILAGEETEEVGVPGGSLEFTLPAEFFKGLSQEARRFLKGNTLSFNSRLANEISTPRFERTYLRDEDTDLKISVEEVFKKEFKSTSIGKYIVRVYSRTRVALAVSLEVFKSSKNPDGEGHLVGVVVFRQIPKVMSDQSKRDQ